jgi:CBS domain-containing protein
MERPAVPTAREIMASSLVTLRPDMMAVEAAEVLLKHRISGAPVVDEEGHLLGLLSEFDLLRAVASSDYEMDAHDAIVKVDQLMSREFHSVTPDMDLFALAHEFVSLRVRRFPVVDDGTLVGQVSRRDALRAAVGLRREILRTKPHYPDYPKGRKPIRDYPA